MKKNKIEKHLSNLYQSIKQNKFIIALFLIIFILLAFQHSVIAMYFDDYGNASLSYSYWVQNVDGTNYNIYQLLDWAGHIYNGWGGRILYAIVFIIPLLKHGITAYMIAQTFVITGIIFFMYKIIQFYSKKEKGVSLIPIILFILYTCIDMAYLRHGIYWASASVLYIWPLLPLLAFIYYYINLCKKQKEKEKFNKVISIFLIVLLSFFATFSQEQIGVGLLGFLIMYIIFHHGKQIKNYLIIDLPALIATIASYIVLFMAPGNWARMSTNVEFSKLSMVEKIFKNYPEILRNIFLDPMHIFMYILCFGMFFMIYKIYKKYGVKTKKVYCLSIPLLSNVLQMMMMHYNGAIYHPTMFVASSTIWLISFFITSLLYFAMNEKIEFCSLEVAAVGTIFCLVLSPTVGGRTGLPFIFFIILIATKLLIDMLNDIKIMKLLAAILLLYLSMRGINNYITVYCGYRDNYAIMKLNDKILRSYKEGNDSITLYKVENIWYGSTQSYEEPSMDFWIKEYYDIPQKVTFNWSDIYEEIR